ncbi:uncharacterized protein LOC130590232 [Beta vulgaris subsp. vulgaris]|uniref:uncharacterized protein LOC130590232 n=1 Tax=Beta vulgaris subsp. vulgaris TaxID=3555 RepID=UPI002547A00A|nr:uncharacterized protein LOC130590232 [Beta vulgaris subsp. vulgaris]
MAERLTSAALKAARIRAEMKANKINKPAKPKDPSNPKPRKRKERTEERVEMTEKALAKARAETEASAKKARQEPSGEVNSPRQASGDDHISLRPEDFEPVRSPSHAQGTSHTEQTLSEAPVPFTQLSKMDKKERIASALEILVTQTDRDHINAVNGRNESSELFGSWMDFSIRMTKVAEDRLELVKEVQSLKEAARKHFDEVYQAKEAKRLAELRLEEANKKIDKGEATWKQEREDWKVERTNLSLAKENAESAKVTAETKQAQAEKELAEIRLKLSAAEVQLEEAQAASSRSQEEWFDAWQKSDDCTDFCADVGQSSHKMGEDEALARLKVALADSCPEADWNSIWSRYQELSEAEAAEMKAKMAEEMSSDSGSDDEEEEEDAGSTEPPPSEQPAAEQPATGEPESYREATNSTDSSKWELVMKDEMQSLEKNQTWSCLHCLQRFVNDYDYLLLYVDDMMIAGTS